MKAYIVIEVEKGIIDLNGYLTREGAMKRYVDMTKRRFADIDDDCLPDEDFNPVQDARDNLRVMEEAIQCGDLTEAWERYQELYYHDSIWLDDDQIYIEEIELT
jgi:hypothetical protein